jgi:hypothetical protein
MQRSEMHMVSGHSSRKLTRPSILMVMHPTSDTSSNSINADRIGDTDMCYQCDNDTDTVEVISSTFGDGPRPGDIRTDTDAPRNAWLAPNGKSYHVDDYGHDVASTVILNDEYACGDMLEDKGWLHISSNLGCYVANITTCDMTQAQRDTLFDWMMSLVKRERDGSLVYWQTDALRALQRIV